MSDTVNPWAALIHDGPGGYHLVDGYFVPNDPTGGGDNLGNQQSADGHESVPLIEDGGVDQSLHASGGSSVPYDASYDGEVGVATPFDPSTPSSYDQSPPNQASDPSYTPVSNNNPSQITDDPPTYDHSDAGYQDIGPDGIPIPNFDQNSEGNSTDPYVNSANTAPSNYTEDPDHTPVSSDANAQSINNSGDDPNDLSVNPVNTAPSDRANNPSDTQGSQDNHPQNTGDAPSTNEPADNGGGSQNDQSIYQTTTVDLRGTPFTIAYDGHDTTVTNSDTGQVVLLDHENTVQSQIDTFIHNGADPGSIVTTDDTYLTGGTTTTSDQQDLGTGIVHPVDPTIHFAASDTYANHFSLDVAGPETGATHTTANDPTVFEVASGVAVTLSGDITTGSDANVQGYAIDQSQPLVVAGLGTGATLVLSGTNTYSGDTTLKGGITLDLASATVLDASSNIVSGAAGTGSIVFTDAGQTLKVEAAAVGSDSGHTLANAISGFIHGDTIDFAGIGTATNVSYDSTAHALTVGGGNRAETLHIDAAPSGYHYSLASDGHGGTGLTLSADNLGHVEHGWHLV